MPDLLEYALLTLLTQKIKPADYLVAVRRRKRQQFPLLSRDPAQKCESDAMGCLGAWSVPSSSSTWCHHSNTYARRLAAWTSKCSALIRESQVTGRNFWTFAITKPTHLFITSEPFVGSCFIIYLCFVLGGVSLVLPESCHNVTLVR